jgi:hypothetical protein
VNIYWLNAATTESQIFPSIVRPVVSDMDSLDPLKEASRHSGLVSCGAMMAEIVFTSTAYTSDGDGIFPFKKYKTRIIDRFVIRITRFVRL